MGKEEPKICERVSDDNYALKALYARDLFGRVFASFDDDTVVIIPRRVMKRLCMAADRGDSAFVEDHSMEAVWADGDETSLFKFDPTLGEDLLAVRATKRRDSLSV